MKTSGIFLLSLLLFVFCQATAQAPDWSNRSSWIVPGYAEDTLARPSPWYRKIFTINKPLASATLYVTAHGIYEAYLNQQKIGSDYFAPGWTSYDKRLQFQEYDLLPLLGKGKAELRIVVGEGWYRGAFGGMMQRDNYGNDPAIIAMVVLRFADGTQMEVPTDVSWEVATGPILHADLYGGMVYDANIPVTGWGPVKTADYSKTILVPTIGKGVRKQEKLPALKVFTAPDGSQLADFGQNLAGWVQLTVKGKKGDTVTLQHAEVLDKQGNFYTGNLREAKATDTYILKDGVQTLEPVFTWRGFRYAKVSGVRVRPEDLTAIALYTAMTPTGTFSCSNPLLNQLQHNITWSLKGNFLDIPTDCPQRSERLGWTGDAQVFFRTAAYNFDVKDFYNKWLQDLVADQRDNGSVPQLVPWIYRNLQPPRRNGIAGWSDAATIVPWEMYQVYGDQSILEKQYPSMKAWVDYIIGASKNGLWTANGYGDWLAPGDSTSLPYIDQCYWAYSTQLLVNTATLLGRQTDVDAYTKIVQQVKDTFRVHYLRPGGRTMPDTQTSYVLALELGMLPDSLKQPAAARLASLVAANGNHLATGFLGTPGLLHALSNNGELSTAYQLLLQDTYPSWLYPVKMGATTIWEKWNAILPDSTVQATSYNHYAYGAVGNWLYSVIGGIQAASPGYRDIIIRPQPGGGLTWAKASYNSAYGEIRSEWELEGNKIKMTVQVPPGTSAKVYVPGKEMVLVKEGRFEFEGSMTR
ncbi:family 78 glycoside hydrolase catalytic domain [Chitinophaga sp. sic0106]|uniref:family 78 glycoside hydrolase catalytic domain n=1 Tax=Chitinophaga sp. sic0106 TaxID=2854785 RepID=UPI001C45885C|nr:family 78 glycoside hydrolase catalytic domain [Chitinophaga sp. sic0106]MBV7533130.1 glycoside hydrolase family 78 protein [Chitinophaga sp. sic0106]